jgi:hypothetical protein
MRIDSVFWDGLGDQFGELIELGYDLTAIKSEDAGNWKFLDRSPGGNPLADQFDPLARRAGIAEGAPSRYNAFDWWIDRLANPGEFIVEHVISKSKQRCRQKANELDTREFELRKAIEDLTADAGVRRDRYPYSDWLPERSPLAHCESDLEKAKAHVFKWYDMLIGEYERIRKAETKDANESATERALERGLLAIRRKKLEEITAGVTYELAVLEANSVLNRSLHLEKAILMYQHESAELLEELKLLWRASCNRLVVTFEDADEAQHRLAEPFHHVEDDLHRLLQTLSGATESKGPTDQAAGNESEVNERLATEQIKVAAINSPLNDVFNDQENRESAIEKAALQHGTVEALAQFIGVDYRDLRAWARDRGRKFAKGESTKRTNIEKYLLPFAPNVGGSVGAHANIPQKDG